METKVDERTMRVLTNMANKALHGGTLNVDYDWTEEQEREAVRRFKRNTENMRDSYARAMSQLFSAPGVRLWPDNGRDDCLSLAGSMGGMVFGIIFHANEDGTGTWSFHS